MAHWYHFSIMALLLLGTQRFLYKVSAERGCNTAWTTFTFMATVTLASGILWGVSDQPVENMPSLLLIALWNSTAFLIATISHIEALKYIPASIVYPIIRLNAAVIVIFSVLVFHDDLSGFQGSGIVIALGVAIILAREAADEEKGHGLSKKGLILTFMALLAGVMATISSKIAATHTHKFAFMALSYFMGSVFSFSLRDRLEVRGSGNKIKAALVIGFIMGIFNFAGFYCFLTALTMGPLAVIAPIMSMHFIIAIILSRLIYHEKMGPLRILCILLTIGAVILLRL